MQSEMNNPLVSVIVPSFNQGRFIRETLESILNQDYRPLELLVIDGGSTDETLEILSSYDGRPELKWWSEPDEGVTDAVNKGLTRASGEILAIQSSDDLYLPGAIQTAVDAMMKQPEVALVYGDVEYIDQDSAPLGEDVLTPFDLNRYLGRFSYIPQPSAFFRASAAQKVGGWRRQISYVADADYWLRIATSHDVKKLDRMMARYRYHPNQRDTQRAKIARDWEQAIRDLIASVPLTGSYKRNALMGIHLAKYRYTPESNWVRRTHHLYQAALANPRGVIDPAFPKRELLVGRTPIWKLLSRTKRALGFSPRKTDTSTYSTKQKLGALIYDLPRFAKSLWLTTGKREASPWVLIRNRNEHLTVDTERTGARCEWEWTSDLHIAKVFPTLGLHLMKRTVRDCPINTENIIPKTGRPVDVSFIIGHRGLKRLPHLLMTLRSIAAQENVAFECIVVEQSDQPEVSSLLPEWVRYLHTPLPNPDMPYSRSWAFNAGAEIAQGKLLILHDNDMLVPTRYAAQIYSRLQEGYEVINLKRFIFYLEQTHSERIMSTGMIKLNVAPESIVQNLQAGGSFGITRDAFFDLGGFDEAFVGWGGEDNEFWQRAQTRSVWPYGSLPLLHLWHEAQPGKFEQSRKTATLLEERSAIPPDKRIEELRAVNFV
jgi:glycosyltransferase involved in cell wall biosynthesis